MAAETIFDKIVEEEVSRGGKRTASNVNENGTVDTNMHAKGHERIEDGRKRYTTFEIMNMNRHQRRALGKVNGVKIPGLDLPRIMQAETQNLKIKNGTIAA